jgi:hypothetical protein
MANGPRALFPSDVISRPRGIGLVSSTVPGISSATALGPVERNQPRGGIGLREPSSPAAGFRPDINPEMGGSAARRTALAGLGPQARPAAASNPDGFSADRAPDVGGARMDQGTMIERIRGNPIAAAALLFAEFARGVQGQPPATLDLIEMSQRQQQARVQALKTQAEFLEFGLDQARRLPAEERQQFVEQFGAQVEQAMPQVGTGFSQTLANSVKNLPSADRLLREFGELEGPLTAICGDNVECMQSLATNSQFLEMARERTDERNLSIVEAKLGDFTDLLAGSIESADPNVRAELTSALPVDGDGNLMLDMGSLRMLNDQLPEERRLTRSELGTFRREVARNPGFAARFGIASDQLLAAQQEIELQDASFFRREQIKARFADRGENWSEPFEDERGNLVQRNTKTGRIDVLDQAPEPGDQPSSALLDEVGNVKPTVTGHIRQSAALMFGGSIDPTTGQISVLDPAMATNAAAVSEIAEGLISSGEETSVQAAVNRAARSVGVEDLVGSETEARSRRTAEEEEQRRAEEAARAEAAEPGPLSRAGSALQEFFFGEEGGEEPPAPAAQPRRPQTERATPPAARAGRPAAQGVTVADQDALAEIGTLLDKGARPGPEQDRLGELIDGLSAAGAERLGALLERQAGARTSRPSVPVR